MPVYGLNLAVKSVKPILFWNREATTLQSLKVEADSKKQAEAIAKLETASTIENCIGIDILDVAELKLTTYDVMVKSEIRPEPDDP